MKPCVPNWQVFVAGIPGSAEADSQIVPILMEEIVGRRTPPGFGWGQSLDIGFSGGRHGSIRDRIP